MNKILILDFGSQVTQLIGRRLRELNVYCEIYPFNKAPLPDETVKGVILSGSPCSVRDANAPQVDLTPYKGKLPLLGICYGAQYLSAKFGGKVEASNSREYGRAMLKVVAESPLLKGVSAESQVWMSHGDTISALPAGAEVIASTADVLNAAFQFKGEQTYAVQFHPEVVHSPMGPLVIENFCLGICGCSANWTMSDFIERSVAEIRETVGSANVILGLSGGVDSSVAAALIHKAIGDQLTCVFVNNGLLRKDEPERVRELFGGTFKMSLVYVDATDRFLSKLAGVNEPERKRKIIGGEFIQVFSDACANIPDVTFLAQGTTYPDVIESISIDGNPSAVIKSHHNVGGLPAHMKFKLLEPLSRLFKDEVREVGRQLGLPEEMVMREPFPGPGLAVRCVGEVTPGKLAVLRGADKIIVDEMKKANLYYKIWQTFAVFLPVRSVGVMGDERTYEDAIAIRAVESRDGMTADWVRLPYPLLARISNRIINEVDGVNRVVYDITSKPPGTIEWE